MNLDMLDLDTGSLQFVLFGLIVALISNFGRSPAWRSAVLLISSVMFVGILAHDLFTLVPLAAFLLLSYCALLLIERGVPRAMLLGSLSLVFAYIWLKKYTFLPHGIFLKSPYFTMGVSYIFFRVLALLFQSTAQNERRPIGFGRFLIYTLNFTTFISGPIQPYEDFANDQFEKGPIGLGPRVVGLQLERIVRGFFKVNVLGALLLSVHDDALAGLSQALSPSDRLFSGFELAVVYPFFLYANFSGYIDMVIALARLMRLRLPENFNRPFSASSFLDFWNRWHITLSTWFKTYVYNPLLMSLARRVSSVALRPFLGILCFFITFFFVGIWHGRTSEFVIYGVLQGGGVSINKLWQVSLTGAMGRKGYQVLSRSAVYIAFGRGLTFAWFAFTLFWLWADWGQLRLVFTAVGGLGWVVIWLGIWCCATVILAAWEWLRTALLSIKSANGPVLASRYARMVYATALGLAALVMTVLLNQPAPGIVYKTF